jgi:hypothetical protein
MQQLMGVMQQLAAETRHCYALVLLQHNMIGGNCI